MSPNHATLNLAHDVCDLMTNTSQWSHRNSASTTRQTIKANLRSRVSKTARFCASHGQKILLLKKHNQMAVPANPAFERVRDLQGSAGEGSDGLLQMVFRQIPGKTRLCR